MGIDLGGLAGLGINLQGLASINLRGLAGIDLRNAKASRC